MLNLNRMSEILQVGSESFEATGYVLTSSNDEDSIGNGGSPSLSELRSSFFRMKYFLYHG